MSVIRPQPPADPLHYDPAAVFATGDVSRSSLEAVFERLDAARDTILADARETAGAAAPARGGPTGGGAIASQPERLLAEYRRDRTSSELFAILQAARRIRETVDRIVVVGGGGCLAGMRAVVAACCHPCHHDLPRGERGGRPRLSFVAAGLDNDCMQGLLDLLAPAGRPSGDDLLDRWALLVVGVDADPVETAAAASLLVSALSGSVGGDSSVVAERFVTIDQADGRIAAWGRAAGCQDCFTVPAGSRGNGGMFTAAGLLPAAIVGVDVVRLLEGGAALTRRFRESPKEDNPVLQHAAVAWLAETELGSALRQTCCWSPRLEPLGKWYEHFLGRRAGRGRVPVTIVAPRDLPAHGPRSGEGRGAVLVTNLRTGEPRREPLTVPPGRLPQVDGGIPTAESLPELLAAAESAARDAAALARRPSADILLPRVDEHAIGQAVQLFMLSAVVEDQLAGPAVRSRATALDDLTPPRPACRS